MGLILTGINHKTAPLIVREKISFTKKQYIEALIRLKQDSLSQGIVILSTCNRMEIYAQSRDVNSGMQKIKGFLFDRFHVKENDIKYYFYILKDTDVIRHIFRVASGLDSQVLGEIQILGQVRASWAIARDLEVIGSMLDKLFQEAIRVGKIVRWETKISEGNVSIGSVAIKMLEEQFRNLQDKSVLIIGAGKISGLVSKYLLKKGIKGIFLSNRTYEKAYKLALGCGGEAINFNRLKEKLKTVDIVISSTASPHLILRKETLAEVMRDRTEPLLIMDLALPRDVDPETRNISNISLYDLDDLTSVVEKNYARRRQEAKLVEEIIQRELGKFLDSKPSTCVEVRGKGKMLCRQERALELVPDQAARL